MKILEERIRKDGKVFPGDVLKIDSFLNHQIDVKLMDQIGEEFYRLFKDTNPDKILTIESSGITMACAASRYFNYLPVVFAKKKKTSNMSNAYTTTEKSYTRNDIYTVQVSKEYLKEGERILMLDDFLANGEALNSLITICNQAKATVVGCGAVVCKTYQPGEERIRNMGVRVECLARVKSMENGVVEFDD